MKWQDTFMTLTSEALAYLTSVHGFTLLPDECKSDQLGVLVVFVRDSDLGRQFVAVSACPSRLELDVTCGTDWPKKKLVTDLYEINLMQGNASQFPYMPYGIYEAHADPMKLRAVLHVLAAVFTECAEGFLNGDESFWPKISESRLGRRQQAERTEIDVKATAALAEMRWADAEAILSPVEQELSPLQKKQLQYARNRLRKG